MCHGDCEGDTVIIVSAQAAVHHPAGAYTQAWAQEQNRKFYQVQRAFVREKKNKKIPVIEKILEECKARNATGVVAIGQVIVDLYTNEHRMMNVYNMKSQLRTAMCVMGGTRAKRTVLDEITQGLVEPEYKIYPMSSTVGDERAYSDPLEPDIHGSGTVCSGSGSDSSETAINAWKRRQTKKVARAVVKRITEEAKRPKTATTLERKMGIPSTPRYQPGRRKFADGSRATAVCPPAVKEGISNTPTGTRRPAARQR